MKMITTATIKLLIISSTLLKVGLMITMLAIAVQTRAQNPAPAMDFAMNTGEMRGDATEESPTSSLSEIEAAEITLGELGLRVHLNKSHSRLNLDWADSQRRLSFRILDMEGRVLRDRAAFRMNHLEIPLSALRGMNCTLQVIDLRTLVTQNYALPIR